VLNGGWTVVEKFSPAAHPTGSNFSIGYIVQSKDGSKAFLKALNFARAFRSDNPARILEGMTKAFNYERTLLEKCKENRLSRVIEVKEHGKYEEEGNQISVEYLILELADGDVRKHLDSFRTFDAAWTLRTLHQVAVGLDQLHRHGMAHQDLKPSNVLIFEQRYAKIGDMGRAVYRGVSSPHDEELFAGDPDYAAPEFLYGVVSPEWECRRLGCDLYLLGSMILFLFGGLSMNHALWNELHFSHYPRNWTGNFSDVLPFLQGAFSKVLQNFAMELDERFRDDLIEIVGQLCEPDPQRRGDPGYKIGSRNAYSLERYVSRLDYLARKAEIAYLKPRIA
jgi:serine/threonine protein kinase